MATTRTVSPADISLYHVAAQEYGDASAWLALANANGLKWPFIVTQVTLTIPDYDPSFSGGAPKQ